MNVRFSTRSLLFATILVAGFLTLYLWIRPGVAISICNTGSTKMKDLVVHVTGRSIKLGDVSAGATATCRVHPTGESHVEITYTLADGTKKHHIVGCYLEPGYRGRIHAAFRDGELNQEAIRLSY